MATPIAPPPAQVRADIVARLETIQVVAADLEREADALTAALAEHDRTHDPAPIAFPLED